MPHAGNGANRKIPAVTSGGFSMEYTRLGTHQPAPGAARRLGSKRPTPSLERTAASCRAAKDSVSRPCGCWVTMTSASKGLLPFSPRLRAPAIGRADPICMSGPAASRRAPQTARSCAQGSSAEPRLDSGYAFPRERKHGSDVLLRRPCDERRLPPLGANKRWQRQPSI
jgi:hypothetical protein